MDKIIKMKCYNRNISIDSDTDMSGDESVDTLIDVTHQAEMEDRLVKGIFKCAHVLEMYPEIVEMVILTAGKSDNIAARIQHKLVNAFCLENDIRIMEVDQPYFTSVLKSLKSKSDQNNDVGCLLITSESIKEKDFEMNNDGEDVYEKFG
ncbi:hypothetical protein ACF0H5_005150 [Mactra antiquata]